MKRIFIPLLLAASMISVPVVAQTNGQKSSVVFAPVYSPEIPASVTLCGEKIDLDRPDMYEAFDRELTSIAYTHGTTMLVIKRANRYFPELSELLKKYDMPQDLLYLACVESSLNRSNPLPVCFTALRKPCLAIHEAALHIAPITLPFSTAFLTIHLT